MDKIQNDKMSTGPHSGWDSQQGKNKTSKKSFSKKDDKNQIMHAEGKTLKSHKHAPANKALISSKDKSGGDAEYDLNALYY